MITVCDSLITLPVTVSADLNTSGASAIKEVPIDSCVASIVSALESAGIRMRGSCCGHGKNEGYIHLDDGRALLVLDKKDADWYFAAGIPLLKASRHPTT